MYAFPYLTVAYGAEGSQYARQETTVNKLVDLKKVEKERQRRIQELEKQISKLKEVLESPLETEDQEKLDAELVRQKQTTRGSIAEGPYRPTHVRNTRNSKLNYPRWIIRDDKTMTPKPQFGASTKVINRSTSYSSGSPEAHRPVAKSPTP